MPKRIFISYRRSDTQMTAGRLYHALVDRFGAETAFRDKEAIRPGHDWRDEIRNALSGDVIVLALIGPQWLDSRDAAGRRRIDDPEDSNRVEIETALSANVPVIPVLVEGATPPIASELPPTLERLTRKQALRLRDDDWNADFSRIAQALGALGVDGRSHGTMRRMAAAVVVAVLLIGAAYGVMWRPRTPQADSAPSDIDALRLPLRVWWSGTREDHGTIAREDSAQEYKRQGYTQVSDDGLVFESKQPGTVALKLFYNPDGENFTTAAGTGPHSADSAKAAGYREAKDEGWIYQTAQPGTRPLKLFYSARRRDYLTTADGLLEKLVSKRPEYDYEYVRTEGYILEPSKR